MAIREGYLDTGVPIAGEGAPLVSEFALMELVAVLGRSPDGGRLYVGRVLECAWRLPNVYAAVVAGRLAPWRAERIADATRGLCAEAAAFVDRQLFRASGVGWAQWERLIVEAIVRFDPERAEAERVAATDRRFVEVDAPDGNGLVPVDGVLDAADGKDLEGATPARAAVLNVHITGTTLAGDNPVGRWDDLLVASEQIRYQVTTPGTHQWTSPTGFGFRVDHRGTHPSEPAASGGSDDDPAPPRPS